MDYQVFYQAYLKLGVKNLITLSLLCLFLGMILIALGAILTSPVIVLSGFGFFLGFFVFLIVGAIKGQARSQQRQNLVINTLWASLFKKEAPLATIEIIPTKDDKTLPLSKLLSEMGPNPSHQLVLYTIKKAPTEMKALHYYTVRSNGKTSSSYDDFRGLYLKIPVETTLFVSIRRDAFYPLKKLVQNKNQKEVSIKYKIETTHQNVTELLIKQLESMNFKHIDLEVNHGQLEVALPLFRLIPKVYKNEAKTMSLHLQHIDRLTDLFRWSEATKNHLENVM